MTKIAKKLSAFYISKGSIDEEEREVYDYCFEVLLSTALNTVVLLVLGLITKSFLCTLLFMSSFIVFRKVSGGFHASTHFRCLMTLIVFFSVMVLCLKFVPFNILQFLSVLFLLIGTILIYWLAPIEHENNPLDTEMKQKLSVKAKILSVAFAIAMIALFAVGLKANYIFSLCYGMFSVAASVVTVIINNKRKHKKL